MKNFFIGFLLFVFIIGGSLFAWDISDFLKYPECMDDDDWIINLGVGFHFTSDFGTNNYRYIPPLRVSFDKNVPIGENNLPFFFGGIVGYNGEGWKDSWYTHRIPTGARVGYHFRFDVDKVDVYAVTTTGITFLAHTSRHAPKKNRWGEFYWGANVGARFFVSENFGFWAEAGFNPFSLLDIGISIKF